MGVVVVLAGLLAGPVAGSSSAGEPPPRVVVIARSDIPVDALAAGPVAGILGAPVVVTPSDSLHPDAANAIGAFDPDLVILAGGEAALAAQVEAAVQALGYATRRVAGLHRHETAARLAALLAEFDTGRPVLTGVPVTDQMIPGLNAELLQGLEPSDLQIEPAATVTEIDQDKAQSGGVTPGDEPGFPVTISEPGSYRLTSNLVVEDTTVSAIVIEAAGVTLDLNGFAVLGPVTCTGVPVTDCTPDSGANGVVTGPRNQLFGGTVQGFGGAGVRAGSESRLRDLIVAHNAGTGVVFIGDGGALHTSTVARNGGNGVVAGTASGFAEVSASTVAANRERGVSMCGGLVLNSKIHRNGAEGLQSGCVAADVGYALNAIRANIGTQVSGGRAIGCNVIGSAAVCP